jgi:small subunit ribosomal protein S36
MARVHFSSWVGAVRRVPAPIWWITGLHVSLLLAYSILLPSYRAPDEPQHIDVARYVSEELDYPAWDERDLGVGITRSLGLVEFHRPRLSAHLTEAEALPKDERPSLDDLDDAEQATSPNQIPQHPPLYYVVAGGAERAVEAVVGTPSYDLEVWFYRLVSIAFVAPLPLIIWRITRLLGVSRAIGYAAALVPLGIPQLTHIGSVVNNDSLMILAFWLTTPLVLRLARGELGLRTVALTGAVTGIGIFTKGFALVIPVWVAGALLLAWRRGGPEARQPVFKAGAVYLGVTFLLGGWWWLRNLVVYGGISPSRYGELVPPAKEVDVQWGNFVQAWGYNTTQRFWGNFGWFDVHLPTLAFGLASAICVVGLVAGCWPRDRASNTVVGDRVLLAAPLILLIATQFAFALRGYLETGRLPGMQGRYWFGALAGASVVIAIGLTNVARLAHRQASRFVPLAVLLGVVAMQGLAIRTLLLHFWGAAGGVSLTGRLRAMTAWAPMPGEVIGAGAVLGGITLLGATAGLAMLAWRGEPGSPANGSDSPTDRVEPDAVGTARPVLVKAG